LVRDFGAYHGHGLHKRVLGSFHERVCEAKTKAPAAPSGPTLVALPVQDPLGRRGTGHIRRDAWEALAGSFWTFALEREDPGSTLVPVEPRFPFFDTRLVRYLLALPPIPYCIDKTLFRRAIRGMLPDRVRLRPKAPLAGDPLLIRFELWRVGSTIMNRPPNWGIISLRRTSSSNSIRGGSSEPKASGNSCFLSVSISGSVTDTAATQTAAKEESMINSQELRPKKEYRTPHVVVYGDIRAITQTSSQKGPSDSGSNNMTF